MKPILGYLKARARFILAQALFAAIFAVVLYLFRAPAAAVLCAFALCLAAGAALAAVDWSAYRRRRDALARLVDDIEASVLRLPAPCDDIEADYQRLLRARMDAGAAELAGAARRSAEASEFYALWSRGIHAPISAARRILQARNDDLGRSLQPELFKIELYAGMAEFYPRVDGDEPSIRVQDLGRIVRRAVRNLAPLFLHSRVPLKLSPIDRRVPTDEKWLCFAIEALLFNAILHTAQGQVTIRMEDDGALAIRDAGAILPHGDPKASPDTGVADRGDRPAVDLGLYLARRTLDRLGHAFDVEFLPGEGTDVRIRFSAQ